MRNALLIYAIIWGLLFTVPVVVAMQKTLSVIEVCSAPATIFAGFEKCFLVHCESNKQPWYLSVLNKSAIYFLNWSSTEVQDKFLCQMEQQNKAKQNDPITLKVQWPDESPIFASILSYSDDASQKWPTVLSEKSKLSFPEFSRAHTSEIANINCEKLVVIPKKQKPAKILKNQRFNHILLSALIIGIVGGVFYLAYKNNIISTAML